MSARDYLRFRQPLSPMLAEAVRVTGDRARGLEPEEVLPAARKLLGREPMTFAKLRPELAKAFPGVDDRVLGYVVRTRLPLVMVASEGRWGFPAASTFTLPEDWLGQPVAAGDRPDALVRSYLAAFGPASSADVQRWSGLRGMREVLERLRPRLETFADERGRELFDLPGAPRPDEDTAAPLRFLPEFDNLVLGHDDRSRVVAADHMKALLGSGNLRIRAFFLRDGFVAGMWRAGRKRKTATLTVEPFERLPKTARGDAEEEGDALLRFLEPEAERFEVVFAP
jgi:hypothetical protein